MPTYFLHWYVTGVIRPYIYVHIFTLGAPSPPYRGPARSCPGCGGPELPPQWCEDDARQPHATEHCRQLPWKLEDDGIQLLLLLSVPI